MDFGIKKLWINLKDFSLRDLVSKMTLRSVDSEKSQLITKSTCSFQNKETKDGNTIKCSILKHISPFFFVRAEENNDENVNSWRDMVIQGPSSYSGMRKPFDDILFNLQRNSQKLSKKLHSDDWELKLEGVNYLDGFDSKFKPYVHGKMLTEGIFSPFFQIGDESNIGVNIKAHNSLSVNAGISKKIVDSICECEDKYMNSLWSSATFQNSAAVLDAKVELVDPAHSRMASLQVSGVCGHNFGELGILSGFKVALDNSEHFDWKRMCHALSLSVVCPNIATVVTIEPNHELFTIEHRLKINDSFHSAVRLQTKSNSQTWGERNNEIGLLYRHSENLECSLKSDFGGTITAGTCFKTPSLKMVLLFKTSIVHNIGGIENMGISIEI